jgi:hypothetical protein
MSNLLPTNNLTYKGCTMFEKDKNGRAGKTIRKLKILALLSLLGLLACNSGTSSSSSSSSNSGTGTGWTVSIQVGTNSLLSGNTTTVMGIVRDKTGAPAPNGTNICFTAVKNGFLKPGDAKLYATVCETTTNNLGQSIQTYSGSLVTGVDQVEVSSQGVIATTNITVN